MSGKYVDNVLPESVKKHVINPSGRSLLHSDEFGVYLGDGKWSVPHPTHSDRAPTFTTEEVAEAVAEMVLVGGDTVFCRSVQAFPDLPGNYCSQNAVANAGLPRWS